MIITKVTMTGADDTTSISEMEKISEMYPFVEWGILHGCEYRGKPRFPGQAWLRDLEYAVVDNDKMAMSCHLCGDYVSAALHGDDAFAWIFRHFGATFRRVQLNTHGVTHTFDAVALSAMLMKYNTTEFIFQFDNKNPGLAPFLRNPQCSALFDLSHGAGELPDYWPFPMEGVKCGYAGGLGPDNIKAELDAISKVVPADTRIWIDMETKVRTRKQGVLHTDDIFDLDKVVEVLRICESSGYMEKNYQRA